MSEPTPEAIAAAKKLYRPRGPVRESMCDNCPFRPDGKGLARDHPDFPKIVQSVQLGLPFYCHKTVIFDPRTKMVGRGKNKCPDESKGPQPHWENCKGAVLLKRGELPNPLEQKDDHG